MNNAVKHAKASIIRVRCVVRVPHCQIRVLDDGVGLHEVVTTPTACASCANALDESARTSSSATLAPGPCSQVTLGTPTTDPDIVEALEGSTHP